MTVYGGPPGDQWRRPPGGYGPPPGASYGPPPGPGYGGPPDDGYGNGIYRPGASRPGTPPVPPEPPPRRFGGRRTAIIAGVIAAIVVGAGGAGAATLLSDGRSGPGNWRSAPGGSAEPSAPGSQPAALPGPAEGISMSATGDIVMGRAPSGLPPNGGKGFFDPVKSALAADLQMGNLEQVLTDDTGVGKCSADSTNCHAFRTPPSYAQHLKDAGFDLMTMANNHANDFGDAGYRNTQRALDEVGIRYTGWPGMITTVDVKGVKVAVVGFASYPWSNLCTDIPGAEKLVKEAAAEASMVVVQVHWGAEGSDKTRTRPGTEYFLGENRCDSIRLAHTVIDAGADLVVGHGPHVVRGMEFYKGRLIAYSLGNFAGYKALSLGGVLCVGGILKVTLTGDGAWKAGTLTPTCMVSPGLPKLDPQKRAVPLIRNLSKSDFPSTGAQIASDGRITPPEA